MIALGRGVLDLPFVEAGLVAGNQESQPRSPKGRDRDKIRISAGRNLDFSV